MTAGPARRMVTLLPRNKPTPIAPPMAIMVSCLWPKRRWSPSASGTVGLASVNAVLTAGCGSVMAADTGRVKHQKIDVFLENLYHCFHILHRVVHVKRYAQAVVTVRRDDAVLCKFPHQQG